MRWVIGLLLCLFSCDAAACDPYVLGNVLYDANSFRDVTGLQKRPSDIDPRKKTLVLIVAGQSNRANESGELYLPPHGERIDVLNIFDGALYNIAGPLPGATYEPSLGPGNVAAHLAERLTTQFNRVILAPLAIGGTSISDWSSGDFANRIPIALARLRDLGITPRRSGVTFALEIGLGESDNFLQTPKASYLRQLRSLVATAKAAGFSGRIFVALETRILGKTSAAIRSAQRAIVDRSTIFQSCDCDSLGDNYRQDAAGHFNSAGANAAATLIYRAMQRSGKPF